MAKQIIGFDIGERQVKMICVNGTKLKTAGTAQLPDNLINQGEILSMDAMGDFLKSAARELNIPRGDAAVVLPSSLVYVRSAVEVPAMSISQLAFNLPYEFNDYLTEDKSQYIFDYAVRETIPGEDGQPESFSLFACAALRKAIEQYRAMFRRAGFRLKVALPGEFALSNLLAPLPQEQDYCIVDVGHNDCQIDIFHGRSHSLRRTIDQGMAELDQAIADEWDVDIHVARTYKLSNYNDALELEGSQELYRSLAVEVLKAVNFYNYNNRDSMLEDLYLCGGGAAIPALREAIASQTNLNVHLGSELLPDTEGLEEPWLYLPAWGATQNL